jgi:hypothetical protein
MSIKQQARIPASPAEVYAIVQFTLEAEAGGTRLIIDQDGEPDQADTLGCHQTWHDHLEANWATFYLTPLTKHFGAQVTS